MDLSRLRRVGSGATSVIDLPEYIITTFLPGAQPLLTRYPHLFRFVGVILALWYFGPLVKLQSAWNRFSSLIIATVNVSSEEDLFGYVVQYISERRTLRADQSLNAISNAPQETRRHRRDPEFEEHNRQRPDDVRIKYEQGQGLQFFTYKSRIFFVQREYGDGHTYAGNRYKKIEILKLSCLGRSAQPVKDLIEYIYYMNKDKERSLTIIRRPYSGGYGSRLTWSRLTAKPRRALDTVILDATQKAQVLADVEEYMDESTSTFYGNHGIPYRRGYLFHGPPGVGKTSFALALASKFNLDVYVLTLLDHDLTDSDLVSLLNQLPGRSLLLLEDIDTAGLSRKNKAAISARRRRKQKGAPETTTNTEADEGDSDEDADGSSRSRISLSGLLNAIDGVAAPEGHILIMTTNKPHELDDALVRAGRISVRVGFKNASKIQAEEIFLRMYVDLPSSKLSLFGDSNSPEKGSKSQDSLTTTMAKEFASKIPDFDFSPADLQDYLLIHKKDPAKAVADLDKWMEEQYEERRRREEEKEVERELKREKKLDERRRFREDILAAVKEEDSTTAEAETTDDKKDESKNADSGKDSKDSAEEKST